MMMMMMNDDICYFIKGVAMDTEPYPVVSGLLDTEDGHVVDSVSRIRSYGYGYRIRHI